MDVLELRQSMTATSLFPLEIPGMASNDLIQHLAIDSERGSDEGMPGVLDEVVRDLKALHGDIERVGWETRP